MNVEHAIRRVLERLSDSQIEALAEACAAHESPRSSLAHTVTGGVPASQHAVMQVTRAWGQAHGFTGMGIALALRTGLAARRDADARRSRPVWTGPGASGEQRLTAAVLRDLVSSARERVLVVSFAAFTLTDLASDLSAAVERGCEVDAVFETQDDSSGGYSTLQSTPFGSVAGINRWRWPADHRQPGALLHAKVLVIDGRRALVGSANLTHRALTANLEAGVLIEDATVARQLDRHVRRLMMDEVLHRV